VADRKRGRSDDEFSDELSEHDEVLDDDVDEEDDDVEDLDDELDEDFDDEDLEEDEDEVPATGRTRTRSVATRTRPRAKPKTTTPARGPRRLTQYLGRFVREVVAELQKVIWPTRKELLTYTAVVVVFVALLMTIVALLDIGFARLMFVVFGRSGQ